MVTFHPLHGHRIGCQWQRFPNRPIDGIKPFCRVINKRATEEAKETIHCGAPVSKQCCLENGASLCSSGHTKHWQAYCETVGWYYQLSSCANIRCDEIPELTFEQRTQIDHTNIEEILGLPSDAQYNHISDTLRTAVDARLRAENDDYQDEEDLEDESQETGDLENEVLEVEEIENEESEVVEILTPKKRKIDDEELLAPVDGISRSLIPESPPPKKLKPIPALEKAPLSLETDSSFDETVEPSSSFAELSREVEHLYLDFKWRTSKDPNENRDELLILLSKKQRLLEVLKDNLQASHLISILKRSIANDEKEMEKIDKSLISL